MAKLRPLLPYIALRQQADGSIRPRFVPGARERYLGFKGQDLRHDDGTWFTLDQARAFSDVKHQEILSQRKIGRRLRTPPVARGRAVQDLWEAYQRSDKFKALAPSSQVSYRKWIKPLEAEAVWLAPVASLDPVILKGLHERVKAARGLAMANSMISALSASLVWGRLHGWLPKVHGQIMSNPASQLDLESLPPRIRIGTDEEIRALVDAADRTMSGGVALSAVGDAVLLGFFSGQRKKDVLEFVPGRSANSRIELVQSKTKALVSIPMHPRLSERMAQARKRREAAAVTVPQIVVNAYLGRAYQGGTFTSHFQAVRAAAVAGDPAKGIAPCPSLADFTFPDLRDTAVTWHARAGCTVPEIASISGHSLRSIHSILKHYLALDEHLADNAVAKLVDYMEREGLAV